MTTAIIDYGMGNVASVQKALRTLGVVSKVTCEKNDLRNAKYIILPGVGSFGQGMSNLYAKGLCSVIKEEVLVKKKPFLGICLGMQLIAAYGTEPLPTIGLGLIDGDVVRIEEPNLRIPHLGWNSINTMENTLFDCFNQKDFYFIHSYHFRVKQKKMIGATVTYGSDYVAAIHHENIIATQFHPEKSQVNGLTLLNSFFLKYA